MKKLIFILILCASSSFADNMDSFATGFAQALQARIEQQYNQQPTYYQPQVIYVPVPQQDSYYQQEQLNLQRQQLYEQQIQNAWWNQK